MRSTLFFTLAMVLLFTCITASAQVEATSASTDAAFWVAYWARPRVILFGPEEEAFYKNMKEVMFPWNDHDEPSNPSALDDNVQWLKAHPNVSFYVDGYASSRGELIYNLNLSQRRAEWVKQTLVNRGIQKVASCWLWDGDSCTPSAPNSTTNAGVKTGSFASPTLHDSGAVLR